MDHLYPGINSTLKNSGGGHGVPTVLLSGSASPSNMSIEEQDQQRNFDQEIQNEINLRLLESNALEDFSRLPFWMRKYRYVSYLIYFLITCFSIYYLVQIAIFQANPKMQIHYEDMNQWLEYNSYSILSPLMCPVMMGVLAYHVRHRVNLEDADFFGILSILLFFALVNIHDGYGVYKLSEKEKDVDKSTPNVLDPPAMDLSSINELDWQYAWTTSRACMKQYVRDLTYQHKYEALVKRDILIEHIEGEGRSLERANNQRSSAGGVSCNTFHKARQTAEIKSWMTDLQEEGECCGPYGLVEWEARFANWKKTGCKNEWKKNGTIVGCYEQLMNWHTPICIMTYWIMYTQALLYIVSAVLAVVHHSAMKLTARVQVKQYSLLDMTDKSPKEDPWWKQTRPIDKPHIVGNYTSKKADPDPTESRDAREGRRSSYNRWQKSRDKLMAVNSAVTAISMQPKNTTDKKRHSKISTQSIQSNNSTDKKRHSNTSNTSIQSKNSDTKRHSKISKL